MSDVVFVAKFSGEVAIGDGLYPLEGRTGKAAQEDFCERLLDYIDSNSLDPNRMGQIVTKSDFWAGYWVLPYYEDEVVGPVNIVYKIEDMNVIVIYMIQVAKKGK